MEELLLKALIEADKAFTSINGIGDYREFDEHIKQSVVKFNSQNNTKFDPFELLHDYLEYSEGQPWPEELKTIELNVDDLETFNSATKH